MATPLPQLRRTVSYLFCLLLVVGLFGTHYFKALPSICIIVLALLGIWERLASGQRFSWKAFQPFAALLFIFVLHLFSYTFTEPKNLTVMQKDLVIKAPLVALPLAFAWLPPI